MSKLEDFEYNCDNGCHHRDVVTKDCVCSCHETVSREGSA